MRIAIDLQGAQNESRFRGIGRYTKDLVKALLRSGRNHEFLIVLSGLFPETIEPLRVEFAGLLPQHNIVVWFGLGPVAEAYKENELRRRVSEALREDFLRDLKPDVVLVTTLVEGFIDDVVTSVGLYQELPTTVIFYDLIPLLNPSTYLYVDPSFERHYRTKLEHLKRTDLLLAISSSSAQEAISGLGIDEAAIGVIYAGYNPQFKPKSEGTLVLDSLKADHEIGGKYLLYSGASDSRKNLRRLLKAYNLLPPELRIKYQLVMAGKFHQEAIDELKRLRSQLNLPEDRLILTGYVSEAQLIRLYQHCTLFVFASTHEGFGLPVLEAMACGAPVIASNTSSLPEIIRDPRALFDPFDESSIKDKMVEVLSSPELRSHLSDDGIIQARRFTWDHSAEIALNFLVQHVPTIGKHNRALPSTPQSERVNWLKSHFDLRSLSSEELKILAVSISLNHATKRNRPTLYVDISELVQHDVRTGIQRVSRSVLQELLASIDGEFRVVPVYCSLDRLGYFVADHYIRQNLSAFEVDHEPGLIEPQSGDVILGLDLQHFGVIKQRAYLHWLRLRGVRAMYVVYDLLPITLPQCFFPESTENHKNWVRAIAEFDAALCISRSVESELVTWMAENNVPKSPRFQTRWFHLGADIELSEAPEESSVPQFSLDDVGGGRTTFVMVSTVEPRKGHAQVLDAFDELWASGFDVNLVVVGKKGWMVDELYHRMKSHAEQGHRFFLLKNTTDSILQNLYASADCLIAASIGEGFGLPIIEAARHQLPSIARDLDVFREVAGEGAFYFAGLAGPDLAKAVREWLDLLSRREVPDPKLVKWLTWRQSTAQLVEAIRRNLYV